MKGSRNSAARLHEYVAVLWQLLTPWYRLTIREYGAGQFHWLPDGAPAGTPGWYLDKDSSMFAQGGCSFSRPPNLLKFNV